MLPRPEQTRKIIIRVVVTCMPSAFLRIDTRGRRNVVTVCSEISLLRRWVAFGKRHFNEMKGAFYMPDLVVSSIQSMVDAPFEFRVAYRFEPNEFADKSGEPHA